jgi:hypothetical protein
MRTALIRPYPKAAKDGAPMACFNKWAIGGCNCGCNCFPCQPPPTGFHVTITGIASDQAMNPVSSCLWQSQCTVFGGTFKVSWRCSGGCTVITYQHFTDNACTVPDPATSGPFTKIGTVYTNPSGCFSSSQFPATFTLTSFSCSPFNVVFTSSTGLSLTFTS